MTLAELHDAIQKALHKHPEMGRMVVATSKKQPLGVPEEIQEMGRLVGVHMDADRAVITHD